MKKTILSTLGAATLLCLCQGNAQAQMIMLSGTSYTENFDTLGSGLPNGVTVFTGATTTSTGTAAALTTAPTPFGSTTAQFANYASATNSTATDTTAIQAADTNRALGFRQTGAVGDPGFSIVFTVANTTNFQSFSLNIALQELSAQTRSTPLTIDYRIGTTGAFTVLGTFADPGAFGSTPSTFSFGNALDNQASSVQIRVSALTASTGTGTRDTLAVDDFNLTYQAAVPEPSTYATMALGVLGMFAVLRARRRTA
ncbi:MAG: PEP-CTERM sorting domain-containing protein [Rhodospirillales bacterium]|nr:PEP-CTERM sorting domain-containing protein [Acetobacter sp.]